MEMKRRFNLEFNRDEIEDAFDNRDNIDDQGASEPEKLLLTWLPIIGDSMSISSTHLSPEEQTKVLELAKLYVYEEILISKGKADDVIYKMFLENANIDIIQKYATSKIEKIYTNLEKANILDIDRETYFKQNVNAAYIKLYINFIQEDPDISNSVSSCLKNISSYYDSEIQNSEKLTLADLYILYKDEMPLIDYGTQYIFTQFSKIKAANSILEEARRTNRSKDETTEELIRLIPMEDLKIISAIKNNSSDINEERIASFKTRHILEETLHMVKYKEEFKNGSSYYEVSNKVVTCLKALFSSISSLFGDKEHQTSYTSIIHSYCNERLREVNESIERVSNEIKGLTKDIHDINGRISIIRSRIGQGAARANDENDFILETKNSREQTKKKNSLSELKHELTQEVESWNRYMEKMKSDGVRLRTENLSLFRSQNAYIIDNISMFSEVINPKLQARKSIFSNKKVAFVAFLQLLAVTFLFFLYCCILYHVDLIVSLSIHM
ncbi:hypothetical protein NEAUS04_0324 [Nematocida ausubeli]|nr:hypothetical protein NEAUS05_0215 [Nematocida ausubeli]KAI5161148.1 hypothetical protein NEAUS04_0324 [Nematocida ausubeli]